MADIPTVKVKDKDSGQIIIINKTDLDQYLSNGYVVFDEPQQQEEPETPLYSAMTLAQLKEEAKKAGITLGSHATRAKFITALNKGKDNS